MQAYRSWTSAVPATGRSAVGSSRDLYKGNIGRLAVGMQYEYIKLDAFPGLPTGAGTPNQGLSPDNQVIMTSIRFYPFQ